MKIALITPCYYPFTRGNSVTARRIEENLLALGCDVRVFPLDTVTAEDTFKEVRRYAPDIIHALHAHSGGRTARLISDALNIPYIITLTGTDIYEALHDARRDETLQSLEKAAAVVAFHGSVRKTLTDTHPCLAAKTRVIPQGVQTPGSFYCHHDDFRPEPGDFVILLPAGLRAVKNVTFPISPLVRLSEGGMKLYFAIIGPVLDTDYAAHVLSELEGCSFGHYFGEVGHTAIGWFYNASDIVLNTSKMEGGMANTVLEAMACGKPVLASDIEGNRSIITEGVTGMLYSGEAEFEEKVVRLYRDADFRKTLGDNARKLICETFSPRNEAAAYIEIYESLSCLPIYPTTDSMAMAGSGKI
jgi:glycosyltransferase involved in cell wall biosynthesis